VNDPDDAGGETNWGITQATADDYAAGPVADLSLLQAQNLYRRMFRDWKIDQIADARTFDLVADCCVNHGDHMGIKWLQSAINGVRGTSLATDGVIGPATLAQIMPGAGSQGVNAWGPIRASILGQRIRFYGRIVTATPSQLKFLTGWLSRATSFLS
jgi:lysozyme family protein